MDPERTAFALRHLYVYPKLSIAYSYVPKNACTSFKRTFGKAQGWLDETSTSAHEMTLAWWLRGLVAYPGTEERIIVVRDPFDRLLSGYLNRFLMRKDPAADHAWDHGLSERFGAGATRAEVSFADFVEHLARTPSRDLNEHWRPQSDFLIGSYTRVIRFDRITADTSFLADRGLTLEQARGHSTSKRLDLGPGWGRRTARRLRRLRRGRGVLPTRDNMYDDHLIALVAERYADDVQLFERGLQAVRR